MYFIQIETNGIVKRKHFSLSVRVDILRAFKYSIAALLTVICGQRKKKCEQTSSLMKAISVH